MASTWKSSLYPKIIIKTQNAETTKPRKERKKERKRKIRRRRRRKIGRAHV